VPVKKKPIEAKTVRRPKAEKKRAKKTSTLNLPSEVEEQVRIHGCENILRAFVAALGSLQNSVSALKSGLADAFDSHSINHSPKYERARYVFAFKTISTFLEGIGIVSYEKRFYRLALALDDLNRGTVDPLFEPIKTGGTKKRNVSWIWCARANVAVGILALLKAGLTRKEAAQQAARDFPKIKELAGLSRQNPSSTATKILGWFDDFNKGPRTKIKNEQALAMFASGRQIIEELPKEADRLRKTANQMFASALEMMLRD
jgi:hypothetical protein